MVVSGGASLVGSIAVLYWIVMTVVMVFLLLVLATETLAVGVGAVIWMGDVVGDDRLPATNRRVISSASRSLRLENVPTPPVSVTVAFPCSGPAPLASSAVENCAVVARFEIAEGVLLETTG